MFDRRQLAATSAAIVLMFASGGYAQADEGGDQADVIGEIVVTGKQKWRLPDPGSSLSTAPASNVAGFD